MIFLLLLHISCKQLDKISKSKNELHLNYRTIGVSEVAKMAQLRTDKAPTVLQGKVGGKRRVGKLRTTWAKAVEERESRWLARLCSRCQSPRQAD
jgi:hypothetical protein